MISLICYLLLLFFWKFVMSEILICSHDKSSHVMLIKISGKMFIRPFSKEQYSTSLTWLNNLQSDKIRVCSLESWIRFENQNSMSSWLRRVGRIGHWFSSILIKYDIYIHTLFIKIWHDVKTDMMWIDEPLIIKIYESIQIFWYSNL